MEVNEKLAKVSVKTQCVPTLPNRPSIRVPRTMTLMGPRYVHLHNVQAGTF